MTIITLPMLQVEVLRGLRQEEVCCWLQRYTHTGEHHKKLQVKVRAVGSSPTRGSSAGWAQV